jgi:hypothetical protein
VNRTLPTASGISRLKKAVIGCPESEQVQTLSLIGGVILLFAIFPPLAAIVILVLAWLCVSRVSVDVRHN